MNEAFIDLDELIIRCRDKLAKKFIQEAVACYRVGAYRSCIVSIWNAVVFDFLHKLRELELFGNGEATSVLQKFEKLSLEKKVKELWQFESDIPDLAHAKFELISTVEKSDIERLFEDRSRCAHPSMTSLEEPFEATAELARYHLRSAVMHLLQRQPVQGRSARERIFQDIKSEYFPIDPERALKHFQKSPLARARFSLVKEIILGLTVSLLIDNYSEDERKRQFAAVNAIATIYPNETREILDNNLSNIVLNKVTDEDWGKVVIYLGNVKYWDNLSEPCHLKAEIFIAKINLFEKFTTRNIFGTLSGRRLSEQNLTILAKASHILFLREAVIAKFSELSFKELLSVKNECKDSLFNQVIINPLILEIASTANLDDLVSLYINDESLNKTIEDSLQEKIKNASLNDLIENLKHENVSLNKLIQPQISLKIESSDLNELLEAGSKYKYFIDEPDKEIIALFDSNILKKATEVSFDELLSYISSSKYKDELPEDFVKPILEENVSEIVSRFKKSSSFDGAAANAKLLNEIVHLLTDNDWEKILDYFCKNDQIHYSYSCSAVFCLLFEKAVGLRKDIQPYWVTFRAKLNNFKSPHLEKLKSLVDSYLNSNEANPKNV